MNPEPHTTDDLRQALHRAASDAKLFDGIDHLLVAVSGGADSVALLRLLNAVAPRLGLRLSVVHVHHGIRATDADADADFVAALAAELDLPCRTERVDVPALARTRGLSLEMAARELRYTAFSAVAAQCDADAVATGHTLDDQAETLWLRLLRGSGPRGLRGIHARTTLHGLTVVRPLLTLRRSDLRNALLTDGHPWREDASNSDTDILRNRVRANLMPLLHEQFGAGTITATARTAALFADEAEWLDTLETDALARCLAHAPPNDRRPAASAPPCLLVERLRELPVALQRRVISRWLRDTPCRIDFAGVERIRALLESTAGTRSAPLESGGTIVRSYGELFVAPVTPPPPAFATRLIIPGCTPIPATEWIVTSEYSHGYHTHPAPGAGAVPAEVWLNAERVGNTPLMLRSRRPGDRMRPLGFHGTRRLQDILVDAKVPVARRDQVAVLTCNDQLVWVAGCRVAEGWQVPSPDAPSLHISVTDVASPRSAAKTLRSLGEGGPHAPS